MIGISTRVVEVAASRELRRSVLRPAFPVGSVLPGDDQAAVVSIAGYAGESLLSACLIFPERCWWLPEQPGWRLRSMATEPAARGTGAGTAVVRAAAAHARDQGAEVLWCEARESAVGFYLRNGWQLHGERFSTGYGPHRYMWTDLRAS